jgi:cytochrome P450
MMERDGEATPGPYTLLSADLARDPYPLYHAIRANSPVYLDPKLGRWLVTGYAETVAVMSDLRFSAALQTFPYTPKEGEETPPILRYLASSMLSNDPPSHTRLRGLVNKAFTPRVVEAMRVRIQELADELIDGALPSGQMDLMRDLAYPLPLIVISEMLGLEPEMRDQFKRWSNDILTFLGTPNPTPELLAMVNGSVVARNSYIRSIANRRKEQPQADLMTALVQAEEQGQRLTEDELYATCGLLLTAGHETTSNLIGNGVLALLRHPQQLARLRAEPGMINGAVEEFLRYECPAQWVARTAKEDVVVGPATIRKGQMALIGLGAANRDAAQFADPDTLDIGRSPNRHVAFGHGIHFCLGAALARIEAPIAIATILRRLPDLRLATDDIEWAGNFRVRSLKALPVTF